jgi:hypothetical protein
MPPATAAPDDRNLVGGTAAVVGVGAAGKPSATSDLAGLEAAWEDSNHDVPISRHTTSLHATLPAWGAESDMLLTDKWFRWVAVCLILHCIGLRSFFWRVDSGF